MDIALTENKAAMPCSLVSTAPAGGWISLWPGQVMPCQQAERAGASADLAFSPACSPRLRNVDGRMKFELNDDTVLLVSGIVTGGHAIHLLGWPRHARNAFYVKKVRFGDVRCLSCIGVRSAGRASEFGRAVRSGLRALPAPEQSRPADACLIRAARPTSRRSMSSPRAGLARRWAPLLHWASQWGQRSTARRVRQEQRGALATPCRSKQTVEYNRKEMGAGELAAQP